MTLRCGISNPLEHVLSSPPSFFFHYIRPVLLCLFHFLTHNYLAQTEKLKNITGV